MISNMPRLGAQKYLLDNELSNEMSNTWSLPKQNLGLVGDIKLHCFNTEQVSMLTIVKVTRAP